MNGLKKGWQSILVIVFLLAGTTALVNILILSPTYQASTIVMVVPQNAFQDNALMQYTDLLTAHYQLTQMYQELVKSRSVAEKVMELEELEETLEDFRKRIYVSRLSDTELIQIMVEDKDPEKAQSIAHTLTQVFMEKVKEIMRTENVMLVEDAVIPKNPRERNTFYNVLAAGAIGLLMAISRIILLLLLDSRIKNEDEMGFLLKLPVLGMIPQTHEKSCHIPPAHAVSEAFKLLSAGVLTAGLGKTLKTLVITSSGPGEGKSVVTANLAAALAELGHRVVIVDANFRNPRQHQIWQINNNEDSVTGIKEFGALSDLVIKDTGIKNLLLVPAGPNSLLDHKSYQEFDHWIEELKKQAEIVLFDTPSIFMSSETPLLAPRTDGVLLVVAAGMYKKEVVKKAAELLDSLHISIIGTVLNKADRAHGFHIGG